MSHAIPRRNVVVGMTALGVADLTPSGHATSAAQNDAPGNAIQRQLGHKSFSFALR
jgi:hypothetical protein